jgi:hypothetical protein
LPRDPGPFALSRRAVVRRHFIDRIKKPRRAAGARVLGALCCCLEAGALTWGTPGTCDRNVTVRSASAT